MALREKRMVVSKKTSTMTMMYDGDGLKRVGQASATKRTTLIWDGSDYLGEKKL